ncbi:hypothetical protein SEVIR_1G332966v4 [Setaria viridis]
MGGLGCVRGTLVVGVSSPDQLGLASGRSWATYMERRWMEPPPGAAAHLVVSFYYFL